MKDEAPDIVEIERLGGLAGFGGPAGRLRSVGRLDLAQLKPAQRKALEALLDGSAGTGSSSAVRDGFRYRLRRATGPSAAASAQGGGAGVEVPESAVPEFVRNAVHDELT